LIEDRNDAAAVIGEFRRPYSIGFLMMGCSAMNSNSVCSSVLFIRARTSLSRYAPCDVARAHAASIAEDACRFASEISPWIKRSDASPREVNTCCAQRPAFAPMSAAFFRRNSAPRSTMHRLREWMCSSAVLRSPGQVFAWVATNAKSCVKTRTSRESHRTHMRCETYSGGTE
jgi:hypothetical protein